MNDVRDTSSSGRGSRSSMGTSRSLIDRVRSDEADAWDRLVTLYAPLVAHWCRRWRLPDEDTADVFQEVFQAVATHITSFRNDRQRDTFRGWLRTITMNKVHDHFRKQGKEPRGAAAAKPSSDSRASPPPTGPMNRSQTRL